MAVSWCGLKRISTCPTCRARVSTTIRNLALERSAGGVVVQGSEGTWAPEVMIPPAAVESMGGSGFRMGLHNGVRRFD